MDYLTIALLVLGFAALVVGYRKNSRNTLVAAALLLLAAGGLSDIVSGFMDGAHAAMGSTASTWPAKA